jgi:putative DNA primase/helicase
VLTTLFPAHGKSVVHVGRFSALLATVRDIAGEAVTAHATWLKDGAKLAGHDPRKILSSMTGRRGCAVRLAPLASDVLGIAEGIETALAASILHGHMPVWAALNTSLLAKFEPPADVRRLLIFADRDVPGLEAAWHLRDRLGDRCAVELRAPPAPANDWADVLEARQS